MSIIVPLLVLGLLVFFHELGHFLVAKRAGITVYELSFGMGPRLARARRGQTEYSLRLLPFGGFVRMASAIDPDPAAESADEAAEPEPEPAVVPRTFESVPVRTRVAVIAAGPIMNFLLAVLLLALVFGGTGIDQPALDSTILGQVVADGPAAAAGLQAGDRIVAIDGTAVADWPAMVALVQASLGREIVVTYERDGVRASRTVAPAPHPNNPQLGYLGVATQIVHTRLPPLAAVRAAVVETGRLLTLWVSAIAGIFAGRGTPGLSGPVGIVQMLGEASRFGFASLMFLAALLSANFGMINLLPIPALDGSRLMFLAYEALRGKPVPPEREGRVHMIGYAFLMALLVLLTYRDLARLGGGGP